MDYAEGPSRGEEGRADLHGWGKTGRKVVEDQAGRAQGGQEEGERGEGRGRRKPRSGMWKNLIP